MARQADYFSDLPALKTRSDNEVKAFHGAFAKLYASVRSLVAKDDSDLPETFNPSDLKTMREACDRMFAVLATEEQSNRKKRAAMLKSIVDKVISPFLDAALTGRDAMLKVIEQAPQELRSQLSQHVQTSCYVPFATVKLAAITAHPGTTDEQLKDELKKIGYETVKAGRGENGDLQVKVPFPKDAPKSVPALVKENGANGKAATASAS